MMPDFPGLTLIADDLTGAADVAAASCGLWESRVIDREEIRDCLPPKPGRAIAINTGSRHCPPEDAVRRVQAVTEALPQNSFVYKKCDSTLRGAIAAEISALCEGFPNRRLIYIGAAPDAGRTVRNGVVRVDGAPVTETPFARDPLAPVSTSNLLELFARAGFSAELRQPGDRHWPRSRLVVADADGPRDLTELARKIAQLPERPLLAGAGGFVPWLTFLACGKQVAPPRVSPPSAPLLVINGSLHPVGLAQIAALENAGVPSLAPTPEDLFGVDSATRLATLAQNGAEILCEGRSLVVRTAGVPHQAQAYVECAKKAGFEGAACHEELTKRLARFGASLLEHAPEHVLLTAGGEYAEAIWTAAKMKEARLQGFISKCLAVSQAGTRDGREFSWIFKPGGFGAPNLLVELVNAGASSQAPQPS